MIRANTCPYCGAPYTLADGGCKSRCPISQALARIISIVAEADERRGPEG
jgi:uncharacterized Zn finger protein (UPF0148 family)